MIFLCILQKRDFTIHIYQLQFNVIGAMKDRPKFYRAMQWSFPVENYLIHINKVFVLKIIGAGHRYVETHELTCWPENYGGD